MIFKTFGYRNKVRSVIGINILEICVIAGNKISETQNWDVHSTVCKINLCCNCAVYLFSIHILLKCLWVELCTSMWFICNLIKAFTSNSKLKIIALRSSKYKIYTSSNIIYFKSRRCNMQKHYLYRRNYYSTKNWTTLLIRDNLHKDPISTNRTSEYIRRDTRRVLS